MQAAHSQAYWWPGMAEAIRQFVARCPVCQARKAERIRPGGQMHSFQSTEPFQLVALGALGPLPACLTGEQHVIVAIDTFSRFVDGIATSDVQGATVARYLRESIGRFGAPVEVLSDNASSFCNEAVKAVLERYRVSHRKAMPHHHEGNAQVERVIQTLQEKLSLITHDPACVTGWRDALLAALLSINSSVHASTGLTRFELIFRRRHALRIEEVAESRSPEQMFSELSEIARRENRAEAVARQSGARQASAERFNASHRPLSFELWELVLARSIGQRTTLQAINPDRSCDRTYRYST